MARKLTNNLITISAILRARAFLRAAIWRDRAITPPAPAADRDLHGVTVLHDNFAVG